MQINKVSDEEIQIQYEYMRKIQSSDFKRKYFINTMGCKLNEADSEKLAGMMGKMGYSKVDSYEEANIVIFNTCSIRENAEEKVFGKLRGTKKYKRSKQYDNLFLWMYVSRATCNRKD